MVSKIEFHHIGICCKDIYKEIENIKKVHNINKISDIIHDEKQNADLCIIEIEDRLKIELISGEIVSGLLKKKISYYHICYQVENIKEEKERFIENGSFLISDEKEAVLFNNKKVCFVQTSYGLVELLEK